MGKGWLVAHKSQSCHFTTSFDDVVMQVWPVYFFFLRLE